ncbi:hypothetical protein [Aminobacter sp. MDW-2]|uniref:hypothetical protein n=1 Tax=Aminobacter sp. MDW-2 TaxID=2666139 RepID=UPI0012AF9C3C|nr:hypothetical protein [Aminobacter sp. MDW-2]MRX32802.1 hypothetical protein [Aminobacter sp. MDW-2]QNH34537.1 hypothetical protein H5P29_00865 [Aminobacter sp. MDW-2]
MSSREFSDLTETVDTLAGKRPRAAEKAAVRIEDLAGLLLLTPKIKASRAGAAPTADEFNALVDDVKAIHDRLSTIVQALQPKLMK